MAARPALLYLVLVLLLSCSGAKKAIDVVNGEWEPVPLLTKELLSKGIKGGEGGQVPKGMAIDPVDGNFLLFGTDVGGISRSIDGGVSWEPANAGYHARGNTGFAIDPNNISRALAVGVNTINHAANGIYLTTDKAATWNQVLTVNFCGLSDAGEQLVFDKSSYDRAQGFSTRAYWARVKNDHCSWKDGVPESKGGIYRSADGGVTWEFLPGTEHLEGSNLKVNPENGVVFAGNVSGLYMSADFGNTFVKKLDGPVTGLDLTDRPSVKLFCLRSDGLFISTDGGSTFARVESLNFPKSKPVWLKVSPANPQNMVLQETQTQWFYKSKCFSNDGGKTWRETRLENYNPADKLLHYLPFNNGRTGYAVWHPTDEKKLFTWSTDWSAKSDDAGNSLQWNHSGGTAVMTGGKFYFSVPEPDILVLPTQDYDAHITRDRGRSWTYLDLSRNNWGGYIYGAYSADGKTIVARLAPSWGGKRTIAVSFDGGETVAHTGIECGSHDVVLGDPRNDNVFFAGNMRSEDGGKNWVRMQGCDGVYTYSADKNGKGELYGVFEKKLVRSQNSGADWEVLAESPHPVSDLAWDYEAKQLYIATGKALYVYDEATGKVHDSSEKVPPDQFGNRFFSTVATDPVNPAIVYAGGNANTYSTDVSVKVSTDRGKTWVNLTKTPRFPSSLQRIDGGREATCIRVHPKSRELYVGTNCYGFWKFVPAASGAASGDLH